MEYWKAVLQRMDLNAQGAWLVYLLGALLLAAAVLTRRRTPWREVYVTFGVIGCLSWLGNIVFFFLLDLLDSGNPAIGGIPDIIMFQIVPSCIAVLYLNLYKKEHKWRSSLLFVGLSLFLEYLLVEAGYLVQKGWLVWYSAPFYFLFFFVYLPWHHRFARGSGNDDPSTRTVRITKWTGTPVKTPFLLRWIGSKERSE